LCERYQVDHAHRTLHGALLDAALLAEVYLAMTRGQDSLAIELEPARPAAAAWNEQGERPAVMVVQASAEELAEHARLLEAIEAENRTQCIWRRFEVAVELS
jgi:DNA polymerase III subunit epsilon